MAVTNLSFGAQVSDWVKETEARLLAVRNEAADDVIEKMREYTPIMDGFLAGTIMGTLNSPAPINPALTNAAGAKMDPRASVGEVSLVINGSKLEDTIYGCFVMAYAQYVEYGTSKMAPRAMVRRAAAMWPQIVNQAVAKAKTRAAPAGR